MQEDREVLHNCFEQLANINTDITAAVYAGLNARMPVANQHMDYMDDRMKGRMLDQVYKLLLGEVDPDYLAFETKMHKGYGADTALYRGLLCAVKDAVSDALGERWSADDDCAWDRSIERILSEIGQLEASS